MNRLKAASGNHIKDTIDRLESGFKLKNTHEARIIIQQLIVIVKSLSLNVETQQTVLDLKEQEIEYFYIIL